MRRGRELLAHGDRADGSLRRLLVTPRRHQQEFHLRRLLRGRHPLEHEHVDTRGASIARRGLERWHPLVIRAVDAVRHHRKNPMIPRGALVAGQADTVVFADRDV